jgi:hypothetical protein
MMMLIRDIPEVPVPIKVRPGIAAAMCALSKEQICCTATLCSIAFAGINAVEQPTQLPHKYCVPLL